jgi:type IV pilus secretin PilQ/predicted competence protein
VLQTRSAKPRFTIKKLVNPSRLVLDIEGEAISASQKSAIADLEFVSGIRIGSHPGSARAVVDLAEGMELSHSAEVVNGAIVITLKSSSQSRGIVSAAAVVSVANPAADSQTQVQAPAARPANLPKAGADPIVVAAKESASSNPTAGSVVAVALPELQPEAPAEPKSVALPASQVKSIDFKTAKGRNALHIGVTGSPEYAIVKSAPSEYVLTIREAAPIGDAATEPSFAEAGNKMRSARATVEGKNTLIRIFSDPSVYLTAHKGADGLIVEETSDLHKVAEDIRAQLKPEGNTSKDAAPAKADPSDSVKNSKASAKESASAAKEATAAAEATTATAKKPDADKAAAKAAAKVAPKSGAAATDPGLEPIDVGEAQLSRLLADDSRYTGRLISLDLQETEIDNALRIIAEVSNLNIVASEEVSGKVTLRLLDVPWDQALDVILKSNGLDKVLEGNVMRIAPFDKLRVEREALKQARVAEEELEPLSVKYVRVSYAKASEIKSLVETVLTERGSVAYDERSNQLIIKDVRAGLGNVSELIKKVDLRTPQVLLETQIVEAERNITRELGSQLGFQYIQSPATGNGTGLNFPAAISIGGSAIAGAANSILGSSFPANPSEAGGSGISLLFDSADGTKTLEARLTQLEQEGKARIISRPAVSTTNNKAAEIKSVKKIRVRLPQGGLSVATGSGAQASGSGSVATETIEAGIILNVTPQASPDYYILLDIKAKSSSFAKDNLTDLPTENERSASSTVLVSSGQTFALGGIYKITEVDSIAGVPFFKDIPFFGTFFRRTSTESRDEELLFFITPRIVEGSFDDASMKSAH